MTCPCRTATSGAEIRSRRRREALNFDFHTGDFDTERWNYVSPEAYQAEVVWLLQWEEEKRGGPRKRVELVAEKASSACVIS